MKKLASSIIAAALLIATSYAFAAQSAPNTDAGLEKWRALLPEIRTVLQNEFSGQIEHPDKIDIAKVADLTGTGGSEALVYLGPGGAYKDLMVLMTLKAGQPTLAKFKQMDGSVDSPIFLSGSSATLSERFFLLPEEHAVYSEHCSASEEGVFNDCAIRAYRFNPATGLYEYSEALSKQLSKPKEPPK